MLTINKYFDPSYINTIEKDVVYHGNWWLPESPKDRVSGVLHLYRKGGIKLQLIGMFINDPNETSGHSLVDHDIILGELMPGGGRVTLSNCREYKRQSPYLYNTAKGTVQAFKIEHLLMGCHIERVLDLKFKEFEFSTTYLVDWVNSKQIDLKFEGNNTVVSTLPNTNHIALGDKYEITITSWATTSLGGAFHSSKNSSITLKVPEPISLTEFKSHYQNPLLDLIQFGSAMLNSLMFVNVVPKESKEALKLTSTSEFDQITHSTESVNHDFFFRLSDIDTNWNSFVENWLKFHFKNQHIFNLYFDSIRLSFQYPEKKFLNMIQGLESYHFQRGDTSSIQNAKELFLIKKQGILNYLTEKNDSSLEQWLNQNLSYFPTLRTRLGELIQESKAILGDIISQELFVNKVINSRNYYTHFDPNKKSKVAEGIELETMTAVLRIIMSFNLLKDCGVSSEKINELIVKSSYFVSVKQLVVEKNFWRTENI